MSITKRCISLLLVLCLVLSAAPVTAHAVTASGSCGENLTWTLSDDGVLTILGTGPMTNYNHGYEVPWYDYRHSITSLIISNNVTTISDYAFAYCDSLKSMEIGNSVTTIGDSAFYGCDSLSSVEVPDSVTRIGEEAFGGCASLTRVKVDACNPNYSNDDRGVLFDKQKTQLIQAPGGLTGSYTTPNSVTTIGDNAFTNCINITNLEISNSVTAIGDAAIAGCSNLTNVKIGGGVTSMGSLAFSGCNSLSSVEIENGVTIIGEHAFYDCGSLNYVEIPDSVITIDEGAFLGCNGLVSVVIGNGVITIGDNAFNCCDSLTSVYIGNSLTTIGDYAFGECNSLSGFYVTESNPNFSSDNGCVLFNKQKTQLILASGAIAGSYVVPDSVTTVGDRAFFCCYSLISLDIPNSVTTIGDDAFKYCTNLTSVKIGCAVSTIGDYAFAECYDLNEVRFLGNAPSFGEAVFFDYEGLANITAYYPADNPTWTADVMQDYGGNLTWVPCTPDNVDPPAPSVDTHDTLDQLTELDYLAFSKLAYRNLDQLKGKTVRQVIGDKWDGFWIDGTTTEFLNSEIYGAIANWTVYKTGSGEDGFYYAVFKAPDAGQTVLAYRGSENLLKVIEGNQDAIGDWFKNDFPMILGGFIGTQFEDACKAYTDLESDPEIWMITTTGHSLGGAWADAVSALYGCDGVSMNAVPILDVVYDKHPQYYGATFTGLSEWNFVDHANAVDVMAGMNEVMFSSSPLKPYISHKNMYTGANIFTYHSMWSMVQRSNDGSVSISDAKATYIPNAAMTQERKLSFVSLGSTSNDMLNKGMNSLKRQSAYGGNGEDQIYTGSSWDKLVGGAGFDVLDGGYGDDTYFYFKGDGHDYIRDIGGSDALYLYGYTKDDAIAIVEDEDIGLIDVYCNGEPVISIYEDGREYKSFTFDKFEVYVVWGNQDYDVYDITSFFKTRKYGSHLLISCPVSIEILDPNGNVVHTLTDGEVGSWYTEYGNFYVFEEENGEYGKVLDLVEGYTARIVGADEGTMDVTYQVPVDGELTEPVSVSNVPVTEDLTATIEETEDGDVYLVIDEDSDGEADSERKLYGECPFTDVPEGSFYYEPVMWAVEEGITNGATETTYNPNGTCLRAQVVTFLHRADGNPEPTSMRNPFTDVKSGDFFYKPVLWAVEKGITNGISANKFGSMDVCNRAAVVTFLWRAAGSPEPESTNNPFKDVKDTDFFYKPVLWAVENGITNGVDDTHFGPGTDCNRAQVVTFLYRAYN